MAFDLLEDFLAFLYVSDGRKNAANSDNTCPNCGEELEEDEETGKMRCHVCEE